MEGLKASGGNVGALVTAIKSPQAVPWVLLIMVFYFFYRTMIEWYQCDPSRRKFRVSKVDFSVSLVTGIVALLLYSIQRMLEFQIADQFSNVRFQAIMLGVFAGALPFFLMDLRRRWMEGSGKVGLALYAAVACLGIIPFGLHAIIAIKGQEFGYVFFLFVVGFAISFAPFFFIFRWSRPLKG